MEKIFRNILDDSDLEALLGSTDMYRLLKIEEKLMALEGVVPPIRDILPVIHACVFEDAKSRKKLLVDSIKRMGLLQRVWSPNEALKRKIEETFWEVRDIGIDRVLGGVISAIHRYLVSGDESAIDLAIMMVSVLLSQSIDEYVCSGVSPRENMDSFLRKMKGMSLADTDGMLTQVLDNIYKYVPKEITEEFIMSLSLLFGWGREDINTSNLVGKAKDDAQKVARILLLIIILSIVAKHYKGIRRDMLSIETIRWIMRLCMAARGDIRIKALIDAVRFICVSGRGVVRICLLLQRLIEVHGGEILVEVMDKVIPANFLGDAAKMLVFVNSLRGYMPQKIIAQAVRSSKYELRVLNMALLEQKVRPRGIALAIPWELYGRPTELLKACKEALDYFNNTGVRVPTRFLLLRKFLELVRQAEGIHKEDIKGMDIEQLIGIIPLFMRLKRISEKLFGKMKKFYGYVPGIYKIMRQVDTTYGFLVKKWEYMILSKYRDLLDDKAELFTMSIGREFSTTRMGEASVLVIIDGLRYDDFVVSLVPKLLRIGFRKLLIKPKISLLPSITNISRMAIIEGCRQNVFAISKRLRRKEEDIIKGKYGDMEFYYGPLDVILNKFRAKSKHSSRLIFVLSELEKSLHGASEAMLVHFVEEYLDRIVELLMYVASRLAQNFDTVRILICSDHGLGVFFKYVDIDGFVEELRRRRLIDGGLEPTIKARYALIPLRSSTDFLGVENIYRNTEEYRREFWLIRADELGFESIEFRRIGSELLTGVKRADSVIILFPKGNTKFIRGRGAVFHGGITPEEMISVFGVFEFSFS